jgi:flagellar hook-associated protein FlgK
MAKIDGTEEEEQYATAVEVDGIRRTLDQFMKRQYASNEAMKKSLDDVLLSLSKLSVSAVEDKGSSFKGKKP